MKKIFSFVLVLVLIFVLAVPSFAAVTADQQATTLQSGWGSGSNNSTPSGYTSSWFARVLYWLRSLETTSNSLLDSSSNIYSEVSSIDTSTDAIRNSLSAIDVDTSSILGYIQDIAYDTSLIEIHTDGLEAVLDRIDVSVGNAESYLDSIQDDISMLQKVLADEDDLALKNSQKQNQEAIEDIFFNTNSDLSINPNKIGNLTGLASSFNEGFDLSKYGSGSPLEYLGEGSEFASWFTEETGLDMDPTFSGSSGDDNFPWPDPDPDPDPDPQPETTATPTITYNESTFTVSASGNGTVLMYVDGAQVSNPYTFTQTYDIQTFVVTATAQETDKLISDAARREVSVPAKQRETTATPTITYNESTFTVSASGNGIVIMYVNGSQVSNPYTFTQGESDVTYVVTATAQETDKLISQTARLDVTVKGEESEPVPETTATPTITYNDSTFTVSASGNGTVIMYVDGAQVSNPYTFTQTYDIQTFVVTATAQETDKLISDTARREVSVPAKQRETTATPTITYNESTFTVSASGNGTVIMYLNGSQVSNPYTFTQGETDVTYVVTATAQETDKLISQTARLDVTVEALPDVPSFPAQPDSYTLITTYTESTTFTAPEDGWYQIEVFGASGNSGSSYGLTWRPSAAILYDSSSGGGGGGGAYSASRVMLNKGDSVILTVGGVGSSSGANFQSSLESYDSISVTSGGNGTDATTGSATQPGKGGSGGVSSGGNYLNYNGSSGSKGTLVETSAGAPSASGGASGISGGNVGASSPAAKPVQNGKIYPANPGSAGFIKVSRGDTNVPVSTFSLRAPVVDYSTTPVTSFYARRNRSLWNLLFGGGN